MASKESQVAAQVRLNQWAQEIQDCQNRPKDMTVDEWCKQHNIKKANYYWRLSEVLKASDFSKLEKLIKFIEEKGEITPKEAEAVSGKSAATVRRYLKILVGTGYVESEGNTNNSVYKISKYMNENY